MAPMLASKVDINFKKLIEFVKIEGITDDMCETVKHILLNVPPYPDLFLTNRKSLQIEYEKKNSDYLEFEIYGNRIEMFQVIEEKETERTVSIDEAIKIMTEFLTSF